jgi:hypothetical protein
MYRHSSPVLALFLIFLILSPTSEAYRGANSWRLVRAPTEWKSSIGSSATAVGNLVFFAGGFSTVEYEPDAIDRVSIVDVKNVDSFDYYEARLSEPRAFMGGHTHGCVAVFAGNFHILFVCSLTSANRFLFRQVVSQTVLISLPPRRESSSSTSRSLSSRAGTSTRWMSGVNHRPLPLWEYVSSAFLPS